MVLRLKLLVAGHLLLAIGHLAATWFAAWFDPQLPVRCPYHINAPLIWPIVSILIAQLMLLAFWVGIGTTPALGLASSRPP